MQETENGIPRYNLKKNKAFTYRLFLKLVKLTRIYLTFFLVSLLTLSSVGLPVFSHICNGMGKTWTSLFVPPSDCCTPPGKSDTEQSCKLTSKDMRNCHMTKSPCCENDFSFSALHSVYTTNIHQDLVFQSSPSCAVHIFQPIDLRAYFSDSLSEKPSTHLPHLRHGRSLLIFEQLFLC